MTGIPSRRAVRADLDRRLPARARAAVVATRVVNALSRRLAAGSGTVAGGHVGLAVDPRLLEHLAAGRRVALVSGTNGKTTTTRLLAVALEGSLGRIATNATGSNMPTGHVTALAGAPPGAPAVLEVDEGYLPGLVGALVPEVVVLLNLSRDQLDRTNEVRMLSNRWRRAFSGSPATAVVANADDPLVVWAALPAAKPTWVAAGLSWRRDAIGCPACAGRVEFSSAEKGGWACACGFARPRPDVVLDADEIVLADGRRHRLTLALPGRFNRANAVMAAAAAATMGVGWEESLRQIAAVGEVAGRFSVVEVGGCSARVMLAKNPAGWRELLDLVAPGERPVVVGINARVADGRDPSWLWDVPFERLCGRQVVATGERCRDLSVRLRYAEVAHRTVRDEVAAVRAAWMAHGGGTPGAADVDFIGNYTAFTDVMSRATERTRA
ncbi:MAG: MurT ligase domain-containing protein [Actinomycetota bacterium]|nr:MurT ligase domain-containing protein [Actinomycetota bacterium]